MNYNQSTKIYKNIASDMPFLEATLGNGKSDSSCNINGQFLIIAIDQILVIIARKGCYEEDGLNREF